MDKQQRRRIVRRIKYAFGNCTLEEWFQCYKEDFEKKTRMDFWEYHENISPIIKEKPVKKHAASSPPCQPSIITEGCIIK